MLAVATADGFDRVGFGSAVALYWNREKLDSVISSNGCQHYTVWPFGNHLLIAVLLYLQAPDWPSRLTPLYITLSKRRWKVDFNLINGHWSDTSSHANTKYRGLRPETDCMTMLSVTFRKTIIQLLRSFMDKLYWLPVSNCNKFTFPGAPIMATQRCQIRRLWTRRNDDRKLPLIKLKRKRSCAN